MIAGEFTPPTRASFARAANLLKVLGHPARLQILLFVEEGEETVTAIQEHAGLTQAMTSQHLKILRDNGLLQKRRQRTSIYYRLDPSLGKSLLDALKRCGDLWVGLPGA